MNRWVSILLMLWLAIIASFIADRASMFKILYTNLPDKLPKLVAWEQYKILFADRMRNCEDSILDEEHGIAYFSCDPGRDRFNTIVGIFDDPFWKAGDIWYYEYAKYSLEDPGLPHKLHIHGWDEKARAQFHPLGLALDQKSMTLFVANLGKESTIELFQLVENGTKATHRQTVKHQLIRTPNSIASLSESEILFTNDHRWAVAEQPLLNLLETYLTYPGGSIVHLNLKTNEAKALANLPFANGIVFLNHTHLAVASPSVPAIYIYATDSISKELTLKQKLRVPFLADNLHVDSNGHLLIAGHPHPYFVDVIAFSNRKYNLDGGLDTDGLLPEKNRSRAGSWVADWDGNENGKLRNLYIGDDYGTASTASRDVKRGVGIASALYDKGILIWKE